MQLTKDDVFKGDNLSKSCFPEDVFPLKKFQQVVDFYEKYKDGPIKFMKEVNICFYDDVQAYSIFKEMYSIGKFNDWLFSYCFKDGLK